MCSHWHGGRIGTVTVKERKRALGIETASATGIRTATKTGTRAVTETGDETVYKLGSTLDLALL
jgi:hypothetical protein